MLVDESPGCEPLRVWGRLEPRARQVDFDGPLQARVHDPLWMLARQWQFGEFKGEDAGSPILTRIARRLTPLAGWRAGSADFAAIDETVPLQARAEQLPIDWRSPTRRASAGRHFIALLTDGARSLPNGAAEYVESDYLSIFASLYPISVQALDPVDAADALALARRQAQAHAQRVLVAVAGRMPDGHALAMAIPRAATWADLPGPLKRLVKPDHQALVLASLTAYRTWFFGLHIEPSGEAPAAWVSGQLEYQFDCALPRDGKTLVLSATAYTSGRLDWHAFDQGPLLSEVTAGEIVSDVKTVMSTPAEFAGMPNARWWQFEDAAVDLGSMRADTTDVAKLMVAEFALLFGNNWFIVPYSQAVGTLAEINGIVVTDVFGWCTYVEPAVGASDGVWTRWDYFSLAARAAEMGQEMLGPHLLLPPSARPLTSPPFESAAFIRDEMADMVWAVESLVPDGDGGGRDGSAHARRVANALGRLAVLPGPPAVAVGGSAGALRYQVGSTVPENWIPFIPVHVRDDTRSTRLQRASMPRFFRDTVSPVRPSSSILREGLSEADDSQQHPFYVDEEEVPRIGICVEGAMRLARWFGGRTLVWHGRRVVGGRGEGGSGLRFDVVEHLRDDGVDT